MHAGVLLSRPQSGKTPLTDLPEFDQYQAAEISEEEYLAAIAEWGGCSPEDAIRIHNHILIEPYLDTEELVDELHAKGLATGCLSNTNGPHWTELTSPVRFPAISRLQGKMASHLVGMNKPDPEIFLLYAKTYGLQPDEIAYFEDNRANFESAANVGFHAKHIDPSQETVPQMRAFLEGLGML